MTRKRHDPRVGGLRYASGMASRGQLRILAAGLCLAAATSSSRGYASSDHSTFENGVDGWESWEVYRSPTDLLQGAYAMYGYDGSWMWRVFELSGAEKLVMDVYFTGEDPKWLSQFAAVVVSRVDSSDTPIGDTTVVGFHSFLATEQNPAPNPDRRLFDLTPFQGMYQVQIVWPKLACFPEDPTDCLTIHFVGYVDNVVVPEPAPALLAWVSLLPLALLAKVRRGFRTRLDSIKRRV